MTGARGRRPSGCRSSSPRPARWSGCRADRCTLLDWARQPAALVTYGAEPRRDRRDRAGRADRPGGQAAAAGQRRAEPAEGVDQRRHRPGARHRARDHAPFTRGGVGYTVLGSVPPTAAERRRGRYDRRRSRAGRRRRPIEVRGLVKRYGELTAVAGVDLTVNAGDVYGYLGPNGAGKTTSLRMMLGLIRPDRGHACGCSGATRRQTVRRARGRRRVRRGADVLPVPERPAQPRAAGRVRRRRRAGSGSTGRSTPSS